MGSANIVIESLEVRGEMGSEAQHESSKALPDVIVTDCYQLFIKT